MRRLLLVDLFVVTLCSAAIATISYPLECCAAENRSAQPKLNAKVIPIIEVEGLNFKDLNKNNQLDMYEDWRLPAGARVANLISQMTLEEKVGQLFHPRLYTPKNGDVNAASELYSKDLARKMILGLHLGHFLNNGLSHVNKIAEWSNSIQALGESSRLAIPILFFRDPPWQPVSPIGFAATRDPDLVMQYGKATARRYRAIGAHEGHKAYLDVATEPRWGRLSSTFGENAELCAQMVTAYMKGCQGPEPHKDGIVFFAVIFPGSGPQKGGIDAHQRDGQDAVYPGNNLDYHLIPWKAAIKAGLWKVMPYYAIPRCLDDVGSAFSSVVINDLLREKLGYQRLVCTDWNAHLWSWGVAERLGHEPSLEERFKMIFGAGVDQIGIWNASLEEYEKNAATMLRLVRDGKITQQRLDESLKRILVNKFKLGLFENPYVDVGEAEKVWSSKEDEEMILKARRKSTVLLKNNGILPLKSDTKVYAPDIDYQALAKVGGKAVNNIDVADVAVVRIDYFPTWRVTDLRIPDEELADTMNIIKTGKPVVVCVNMNRPWIITELAEKAAAILGTYRMSDPNVTISESFKNDTSESQSLAEILFGKFNPTGKLAIEIPRTMKSVELQLEDVPYDCEDELWPYDFGMNYGVKQYPPEIEYGQFKVSKKSINSGDKLTIDIKVRAPCNCCINFEVLVDDKRAATIPVGLMGGKWQRVIHTLTITEEGIHEIRVGKSNPKHVLVKARPGSVGYFEVLGESNKSNSSPAQNNDE